ncbi:MAG: FTR1 family iron permease [Firmicutes bacterium]|nr:FTR1 family iron permease [Bacillota bacterium]
MEVLKRSFAVLCMILVLICTPVFSFADQSGEYYKTWEEYYTANNLDARNWHEVADAIDVIIDHAVELYEQGDSAEAYEYAKATYWGYYETTGFERNTMTYISGRVGAVELQFTAFRKAIKKDEGVDKAKEEGAKLSSMLHEDAEILQPGGATSDAGAGGTVAVFLGSLTIILREGLEAILIVGAIAAYLRKSGNLQGLKPVYGGAIIAVACSFAMAALLSYIKNQNAEAAMSQEIIEGIAALTAVAVLFYVSNWMVSKSEAAVWSSYIEKQVASSVTKGSIFALAFTSWLAVFREGAEVILFYQPLMQESSAKAVWGGFILGCVLLVGVWILIHFVSVKLPLKPFFMASSILMAVMSICFLGAGIKELIEGGVINASYHDWFPINDTLDMLGLYPLYETLIPQAILLVITIITFVIWIRRNNRIAKEAATKAA